MITTESIEINKIIRQRRSAFTSQFDHTRKIPDEIISEILQNANTAPTHKLTEPWRFTVFSGAGLETLGQKQAAIYKENAGEKFKENKYESLKSSPKLCSHIIAIGCKRNIGMIPEMEEIAAVACAVQNIYLSLDAYGIGGYWSTGGITFMEQANELVGLAPEDIFMGFFHLGYVQVPSAPRTPSSIESKISWVRE